MKGRTSGSVRRWLPVVLWLAAVLPAVSQQPPQKKALRKASRYTSLPSGYARVGSTQLYYKQNADAIDMIGYYGGYYYSSTFADYGYKLSVQVGQGSATRVDCLSGTTVGDVTVRPRVEQQGDLARVCYAVTNSGEADVSLSLGVHADVMIGSNDYAPISRRLDTAGQPYGLTMLDGDGAQLCVLFGAGLAGVTAVNDFWFGHYNTNSSPNNMVGNYSSGSYYMQEGGGYDSGMGWCWKNRVVGAGATVTFSYLIGVGEVNLEPNSTFEVTPEDPDGWNDLSRPHKLTLEGSYESPAGLDGRIEYAVETSQEWTALTEMLPSGSTFSADLVAMFDAAQATHVIRFRTVDNVGNTSMLPSIEYKDVSFYPVGNVETLTFTGEPLTQQHLTCELEEGLYVAKNYQDNVHAGTSSFAVEGVFPKTIGRRTYSFAILPQPLGGALELSQYEFVYSGQPFTPAWQFTHEDYAALEAGRDYTAQWSDNVLPGEGLLTVTGQGDYAGTLAATLHIDKAPLTTALLGLTLPPAELIYDEQPHPATAQPAEGVGAVSITYRAEATGVETSQAPTVPGTYRILVAADAGTLYHAMEQTAVGTVAIALFNTEQYAYLSKIAADTENYHMYMGVRTKLVQFVQNTAAALDGGDLAAIHAAFQPLDALLDEAAASMADYDRLDGYIYYTERLLESYGVLFTDDIKEKIQNTIATLQDAYNFGAMTGEQIGQVWPQLQATVLGELRKYTEQYTSVINAMVAQGLTEDLHAQALQTLSAVQDLLGWGEYRLEDIEYIKGLAREAVATAAAVTAQVEDLAILRQAYLSLGGAETLASRWQLETPPYRLSGVTFAGGRITDIALSGAALSGTLPTSFFLLPELQTLNLSGNQLDGDLTAVWQQLADMNQTSPLTTLNLAGNAFSGNLGQLLAACPQLRSLNASNNHLLECQPAPDALESLNLRGQTLDWTWDFLLSGADTQACLELLPGILRYDRSASGGLQRFVCRQGDWTMELACDDSTPLHASWVSGDFTGDYGAQLEVTAQSGEAAGSTFRMSFKFLPGDANFSGATDISDLQTIIRYIFKDWTSGINVMAANLYVDERVNVQDVVRLVDLLLSDGQATQVKRNAPARVRADGADGDAAARLFWRGNELVLNTSVPVAAADICIDGTAAIRWQLAAPGFTLTQTHSAAGTHAIFYSLADAVLPAGETVVATRAGSDAALASAQLADRDARRIGVALTAPLPTGIDVAAAEGPWTLLSTGGIVVAQGVGRAQLRAATSALAAGIYVLQDSNHQNRKITLK